MNIRPDRLSRRTVLRGAGITLALPLMDSMLSLTALGEVKRDAEGAVAPRRAAFIYIPNGFVEDAWTPQQTGAGFELPRSLASLKNVKSDINILSHLDRKFVGGTGVHAQAGCCWLTSSAPTEVLDGGFPTNTSIDQMIAKRAGKTLLPSLELSCNDHPDNKETKYFESISWYSPGYAASVEKNPRAVFERLFGNPAAKGEHSVLDTVLSDASALRGRLGKDDRAKLDEYLDSVRATEKRIQFAEQLAAQRGKPPIAQPEGIPDHRGQYIRLQTDLMALAFQLDLTRVATIVIDPERWDSPRMYHDVFDKPQNHHVLTHTKGDEAKEKLRQIDRFHVEQYAYLVEKLKSMREGDGSVLDNSVVAMGSGLSDGRVHDYGNLSVLLAGRAGGRIATGRHLAYKKGTPLANLWLTLLNTLDVPEKRFADSTGLLTNLRV